VLNYNAKFESDPDGFAVTECEEGEELDMSFSEN